MLKVWQISYSDISGGAARAAYRLHNALLKRGVDSSMHVVDAKSGLPTVFGSDKFYNKATSKLRYVAGDFPNRFLTTGNPIIHSPAILPSRWPAYINNSDADLVHLHWVSAEMMSVRDIARIKKPIVWTLHDMWAFCGAEHFTDDVRWREGYHKNNRPAHESGFDLNRWTWNRKRRAWKNPIQIITPSYWLASCVESSKLMQEWPVSVIRNALDTETWRPIDKAVARDALGIRRDKKVLAFGAILGGRDPRKGFDLLQSALLKVKGRVDDLEVIIFGERRPVDEPDIGFPAHYTGHLHDDISLRMVYSAADAVVIPSRAETFAQVASESFACATPVVAFNVSGLPDIVSHKENGWLADAFDTDQLASGIEWVLDDAARLVNLSIQARKYAEANISAPIIADQHLELYRSLKDSHRNP